MNRMCLPLIFSWEQRNILLLLLRNGELVTSNPDLSSQITLLFPALRGDLILDLTGYVWISKHVKDYEQEERKDSVRGLSINIQTRTM